MIKEKIIKLLLVDDEIKNVQLLSEVLKNEGFLCQISTSYEEATSLLEANEQFSLGIFDLKMPTVEDGLSLIRETKSKYPEIGIIVLSAFGEFEENVDEAYKAGADFFLDKVFDKKKLLNTIRSTIEKLAHQKKDIYKRDSIIGDLFNDGIVGNSKTILELKSKIVRSSNQAQNIFIYGESGTGKELVAMAIHHYSARRDFPYIVFNCSAIPETLIENELFGYVKGAFTDAKKDKKGFFEKADGGTLFIDEIGDMSMNMQAKVLKAIENKEFCRVGSEVKIKVDIQIITASNKDPEKLVEQGAFREDLFYRIKQNYFHLPSLRERKEDISLLAEHFISTYTRQHRLRKKKLSKKALDSLMNYDFPGNIRELKTIIERALDASQGAEIEVEDLDLPTLRDTGKNEIPSIYFEKPFNDAVGEFEKIYLENLLRETKGNISLTSEKAGIERTVLYRKFAKYDINPKLFKR